MFPVPVVMHAMFLIAGILLIVSSFLAITIVGKPREPLTPAVAAATVLLNGWIAFLLLYAFSH